MVSFSDDYLSLLEAFVVTATTLSFVSAAERLSITPSTLSRRVKKLENSLGVQLLTRTTRAVSLTEAGGRFLVRAGKILDDISTATLEARSQSMAPGGKLTVTVPLTYGRIRLSGFFNQFLLDYPEVKLNALYTDSFLDLVDQDVDVAIRIGNLEDSSLRARRLGVVRRHVVASPDYLSSHVSISDPADLSRHKLLHFSPLRDGSVWKMQQGDRAESVMVSPYLYSNDATFLLEAALAGRGIALLADFLTTPHLQDGSLTTVLEGWDLAEVGIYALYPKTDHMPKTQRVFLDRLASYFTEKPKNGNEL